MRTHACLARKNARLEQEFGAKALLCAKRGLKSRQKRPANTPKETCRSVERLIRCTEHGTEPYTYTYTYTYTYIYTYTYTYTY